MHLIVYIYLQITATFPLINGSPTVVSPKKGNLKLTELLLIVLLPFITICAGHLRIDDSPVVSRHNNDELNITPTAFSVGLNGNNVYGFKTL
jgi:hypothetical protein